MNILQRILVELKQIKVKKKQGITMEPITSAISSIRIAYDIAKGIRSLNLEVERNDAISKILEILLSVQADALIMQEKYQTLLNEKNELTQQLMNFETWKKTKTEYGLYFVRIGTTVIIPKEGINSPYKTFWLCANCFENKKKSYLQAVMREPIKTILKCSACPTIITLEAEESSKFRQ
jgi:hypothetical protein